MRRITTLAGPPQSFIDWQRINQSEIARKLQDPNISGNQIWSYFKDTARDVYSELKETLVHDQGYICCYCGQRIEVNHHTSIEHLYPKKTYKDLVFYFDNLLASCNGGSNDILHVIQHEETIQDVANHYGVSVEHLEDVYVSIDTIQYCRQEYDIDNLSPGDRIVIIPKLHNNQQHCDQKKGANEIDIHPLQNSCESKFRFDQTNGKIIDSTLIRSTVKILGLNSNRYINEERIRALDSAQIVIQNLTDQFGQNPNQFNLHRKKILRKLKTVSHKGYKLEPFTFVKASIL